MKLSSEAALRSPHKISVLKIIGAVSTVLLIATVLVAASNRVVTAAAIGSKTDLAEGLCLAVLPLALYFAITRPFIFPFGLYVLIVPLDPLLSISSRIGTVTKLVGLCCGLAFLLRLIRGRHYSPPSTALFLWLFFLVWGSLSVFWAIDPTQAAKSLPTYVLLIALYAIVSVTPITAAEYRWLLITIVLSGLVGAAGAMYLYHSGQIVRATEHGVSFSRVLLQFSAEEKLDPNSFSVAFLLPIAIVLTEALRSSWSLAKVAFIGLFLLMVGGIYLLASRGAELALAMLIAYMMIRSRFRKQLIAFSLVALGMSLLLPTSPFARFTNALQSGGSGRVSIWRVGLAAFKHHWLVGGGVGNFLTSYNESFIRVYQRVYAGWHRAPHNIIVEVAVEFGVVGLVLFLGAWYAQWRSMSAIAPSSQFFDLRIALEAALASMFVAGLFGNLLEQKIMWEVLGLLAVTRAFALSQESMEIVPRTRREPGFSVQYRSPPAFRQPTNA